MRDDSGLTHVAATTPIGALLLRNGALTPARLDAALEAQNDSRARLGSIVSARGWSTPLAVAQAAAEQAGADVIDLVAAPPDPALLDPRDAQLYTEARLLPWRREGDIMFFVADDWRRAQAALSRRADSGQRAQVLLAEPCALETALAQADSRLRPERAANAIESRDSMRAPTAIWQRAAILLGLVATLYFGIAAPGWTAATLFAAMIALNGGVSFIRSAALLAVLWPGRAGPGRAEAGLTLSAWRKPPRFTLLVPLLREPAVMPQLIESLERLDWPHELLDVKLILEADDAATRAAIEALDPAPFIRIVTVPPGGPRTKPRALNFAHALAEGDLIGIYDAEDRPDPAQLRKVAAMFREAGPELGAVQCRLNWFNARESWLTRCLALEYAIWFNLLLPGYRRLGLPVPLGGTSVFLRRAALERVGGWDAHNVTEDADLGLRLSRAGLSVEFCDSVTEEEATIGFGAWMRQRSRWLKGYLATWLVHMRRPLAAFRELGAAGFIVLQTSFLGVIAAYLGMPLVMAVWAMTAFDHAPGWLAQVPGWAVGSLAVVQLLGWGALFASAIIVSAQAERRWLLPTAPTLLFYWPLAVIACVMALAELIVNPMHWRKTEHGVSAMARAAQDEALKARNARIAAVGRSRAR